MNFVPLSSYDNYVSAHLAMGRLEAEGIKCWLKDEYTVSIDPILTNAVGGIKLMVDEEKADEALGILNTLKEEYKATLACPNCGSHDIEYVSSPRKASNWFTAIFSFLLGNFAMAAEKQYHCFKCGHEFKEPVSVNTEEGRMNISS